VKIQVTGESEPSQIEVTGGTPATVIDVTAGTVSSVNGKTGAVTLTAADVGAMPASGGSGSMLIDAVPGTVDSALPAGYGTSSTATGLTIGSTYPSDDVSGGVDGTGRINLYSYQRANVNSFGEVIRAFAMRKDSKQMLAWYAPSNAYAADRSPNAGNWKPVTWIGSHWESNGHTGNHKHWEIEIPDRNGALQGRFEILFGNQADDTIGLDKTNIITNLADFTVRCHGTDTSGADIQQALRLSANAGFEKALEFSNDTDGVNRRWKIRTTSEAESGSNAGSNFHIARYDDTGTLVDAPIQVARSNGQVTIGGTGGTSSGAVVNRNGGIALTVNALAAGGQGILVNGPDNTAVAYQGTVTGDVTNRLRVFIDGKHEWGDGTNARDVNLYRSSAGVLKTDQSLHVVQNLRINTTSVGSGVGVVGIANATTAPAGTPTGGGVLYASSGLPRWKGSDGVDYDLVRGQFPVTLARKTADETVTNSTTVQDDDQLTAAVAASSTYLVEAFLIYDGDTTGDFRLTFAGPTGATMDWTPNGLATSQATGVGSMKLGRLPIANEDTLGASGSGVKAVAMPRGILTTSSTAGNLTLRWAQATASATATTVFANSWLRLTKIA
jgi:hypothetical protein